MIRFSISVCVLLIIFGTDHGKSLPEDFHWASRIVGGRETEISKVPYQAGLVLLDHYFCGGAIISEKYVVTGAHCIVFFFGRDEADDNFFVRVGSNYPDKGGVLARVKRSICHPKFNFDTYDYDVCLLELESPLTFSENIQPVKLADREPEGGEMGIVAGWGTLWENGKSPDSLQSVVVPVMNKTYCYDAYEDVSPVTERMFCAGEEGMDSCQGDSGGGLVVDGALVGIISSGYGCGVKNYPGVYASIGHPQVRKFFKKVANL